MARLNDLANCILIQEVKKRPCLFIKGHPRYNDIIHKRIMWDEVAEKVFQQHWSSATKRDKEDMVDTLLTRWRSLRTCFSRELRTQMRFQKCYGHAVEHKREYRYYNDLMFLKPHVEVQKSEVYVPINISDDEEDSPPPPKLKTYSRRLIKTQESEKNNEPDVSDKRTASTTNITTPGERLPLYSNGNSDITSLKVHLVARTIKIKRSSSDVDNFAEPSNTVDKLNPIESLNETTIIKAESPVEDLFEATEPTICSKPSSTDSSARPSENWEGFLLSLIPMLEVLPAHKTNDARIAILAAVKQCLNDSSDINDNTSNMADQDGGLSCQNIGGITTSNIKDIKREQSSDDDEDIISLNHV